MKNYSQHVGSKLNNLLEKNYDAEKGFSKAYENTKNTQLKSFFQRKAQERNEFSRELQTEIRAFGQDPKETGSATGTAHRAWMDVKALFSSDNEEAMLEEAIKGEKAAVDEYKSVLSETNIPASTQTILQRQKSQIERTLSTVKQLEDLS